MRTLVLLLLFSFATTATAGEYQLLRFRAPWCPPCNQQKQIFKDGKIATALRSLRVRDFLLDVDTARGKMAATDWKVKSIPTTVLVYTDDQGKTHLIKRWGDGKDPLLNVQNYRYFVDPEDDRPKRE